MGTAVKPQISADKEKAVKPQISEVICGNGESGETADIATFCGNVTVFPQWEWRSFLQYSCRVDNKMYGNTIVAVMELLYRYILISAILIIIHFILVIVFTPNTTWWLSSE